MSAEITPEAIAYEYEIQQFLDWVDAGIDAGWVSPAGCMTHNALPLREWEEESIEDGNDPCILVMRVWKDGYEHLGP